MALLGVPSRGDAALGTAHHGEGGVAGCRGDFRRTQPGGARHCMAGRSAAGHGGAYQSKARST